MNGINPPHEEEESEKSCYSFSPFRFERLRCHDIDEDRKKDCKSMEIHISHLSVINRTHLKSAAKLRKKWQTK